MKPYDRFGVALDIQDACNLRAIAREFVKVVDAAAADVSSTESTWSDSAVRLVANKIESLCHSVDADNFSIAYAECNQRCGEAERIADHIDGYDRDDLGESPDF